MLENTGFGRRFYRSKPVELYLDGKTFVCPKCRTSLTLQYAGAPVRVAFSDMALAEQLAICRRNKNFLATVPSALQLVATVADRHLPLSALLVRSVVAASTTMPVVCPVVSGLWTVRFAFEEATCAKCLPASASACLPAEFERIHAELLRTFDEFHAARKAYAAEVHALDALAVEHMLGAMTLADFRSILPDLYDSTLGKRSERLRRRRQGIPAYVDACLSELREARRLVREGQEVASCREFELQRNAAAARLRVLVGQAQEWDYLQVDFDRPDDLPLARQERERPASECRFVRPDPNTLAVLYRSATSWKRTWTAHLNDALEAVAADRPSGGNDSLFVHRLRAEIRRLMDQAASPAPQSDECAAPPPPTGAQQPRWASATGSQGHASLGTGTY